MKTIPEIEQRLNKLEGAYASVIDELNIFALEAAEGDVEAKTKLLEKQSESIAIKAQIQALHRKIDEVKQSVKKNESQKLYSRIDETIIETNRLKTEQDSLYEKMLDLFSQATALFELSTGKDHRDFGSQELFFNRFKESQKHRKRVSDYRGGSEDIPTQLRYLENERNQIQKKLGKLGAL